MHRLYPLVVERSRLQVDGETLWQGREVRACQCTHTDSLDPPALHGAHQILDR
jgi:hypothetical protein